MIKNHSKQWLVLLLVVVLSIWGWLDVRNRGFIYPNSPQEHRTDLTVYTEAGAAFFDGRNPYEVENPRGWTYLYPPLFALLLAPLSPLQPQNQVLVWFFLSLLFCWGCYRECGRIVALVCDENPKAAAAWRRRIPWLGAAAILTALLPTLNCLQRGQVGTLKMYLLLLGFRIILGSRTRRAWLIGGIVLALPIVLKILPAFPVGVFLFLEFVAWLRSRRPQDKNVSLKITSSITATARPRFTFSTLGVAIGLPVFFLVVPTLAIGWSANLRHLDTWGRFMLTKADDGGMDPRSGNSHSARNQSLHNAVYRFGNFSSHLLGGGPDDRLVERFDSPKMAMDSSAAERMLLLARAALGLTLLALCVRLARNGGSRLNLAVGFALSCVGMLAVSPIARGHYFLLLAPAVLLVPIWLECHGRPQLGTLLAAGPPVLSVLHYVLLPYAGRVGLLGLGTAAWLMATMVVMARTDWANLRTNDQNDRIVGQPSLRQAA